LVSSVFIFIRPAFPVGMSCDGSQLKADSGWVYIPAGRTVTVTINGQKYNCTGCGRCVPVSQPKSSYSGGGYSGGYASTGNWKQDMMYGLMQSFMEGFMRGLQNNDNAYSSRDDEAARQAQEAARRAEEERRMAEWKAKTEEQIREMQKQYAVLREQEFKNSQQKILSKLKGTGASAATTADRGGLKHLACSHYWSTKAADEKDIELAKIYSGYAAEAMSGDTTHCPQDLAMPSVRIPEPSYSEEFKKEFLEAYIHQMNDKVQDAVNLRQAVADADKKEKQITAQIQELKTQKTSADDNQKQEIDELLAQAQAALDEAAAQKKQSEESLNRVTKEITALKEINKTFTDMETKK